MHASSRSPSSSRSPAAPKKPLPSPSRTEEADETLTNIPYLFDDDAREPFRRLDAHPLSLICRFYNVKQVTLEEGVPPPNKLDVPLLRRSVESFRLLPTHVLAVYEPERSNRQPQSSAPISSGPSGPIMIPVNADHWALHLTHVLPKDIQLSSPRPSLSARRSWRHSRADSFTSSSSSSSARSSNSLSRPSTVLSLPVHSLCLPSAKTLPLLLLLVLQIVPESFILPALLPRAVLNELPAPPVILTERLMLWLYPETDPEPKDEVKKSKRRTGRDRQATIRAPVRPRSPRLLPPPMSPLLPSRSHIPPLPPSPTSSIPSFSPCTTPSPSPSPAPFLRVPTPAPELRLEPICTLADRSLVNSPDSRLLALAQQNLGLWVNALSLGVRNPDTVRHVETAWSVVSEARRRRFGDLTSDLRRPSITKSRSAPDMKWVAGKS